jgi:hypothetical protein
MNIDAFLNGFIKAARIQIPSAVTGPSFLDPEITPEIKTPLPYLLFPGLYPKIPHMTPSDAFFQRNVDNGKLNAATGALGMTPNIISKSLAYLMTKPNNSVSRIAAPFLGGNPALAASNSAANLQGISGVQY